MTSETDSNAENSDGQESPQEATKRRFREALEAKQGRHGEDHIASDPHGAEHAHGQASGKRVFRRKTG